MQLTRGYRGKTNMLPVVAHAVVILSIGKTCVVQRETNVKHALRQGPTFDSHVGHGTARKPLACKAGRPGRRCAVALGFDD